MLLIATLTVPAGTLHFAGTGPTTWSSNYYAIQKMAISSKGSPRRSLSIRGSARPLKLAGAVNPGRAPRELPGEEVLTGRLARVEAAWFAPLLINGQVRSDFPQSRGLRQ
jgi:hypothetical protein